MSPQLSLSLLRYVLCIALLSGVISPNHVSSSRGDEPARSGKLPNIVLIVSDDQHWQDYEFMGQEQLKTPNLNRLAEESLLYKRGYVPSSLCCPSLATILTGLYPHQHKITSNDPPIPSGMKPGEFQRSAAFRDGRERMNEFMKQAETLPRLLQAAGYRSLQTGKWWQGNFSTGGFTDGMTQGDRHGDAGLDIGRKTMEPIRSFIADCQQKDQPFFVWYAPFLPHSPHNAPERIVANSRPRWKPGDNVARGPYLACIEWFDETIGELMSILDDAQADENTLVIYVTDNGWICGDRLNQYGPRSKQSPYDGGIRTPIMLRWKGKVVPTESAKPVMSIDIAPTVLAAVGIPPTSAMQGVNLLDEKAVEERNAIYGECFTHNAVDIDQPASSLRWRWIIHNDMKLIVPAPQNESGGKTELFQIAEDHFEQHDVSDSQPEVVRNLGRLLDQWWDGKDK
jgi:arylsulfatase A-like enzyme